MASPKQKVNDAKQQLCICVNVAAHKFFYFRRTADVLVGVNLGRNSRTLFIQEVSGVYTVKVKCKIGIK